MKILKILVFILCTTLFAEKYSIDQFLDTVKIAGFYPSYDEKTVYYSSDKSGIFNVYAKEIETHRETALTDSKNYSIFLLSAFPEDNRLLVTFDEGGNERNHIYVWENEKPLKDITPFPGAKADFYGWSHDQKSFFFISNARDPKAFDVYEVDVKTLIPKLIFKNENLLQLNAISRNKELLAFTKTINRNTTKLYLYDRKQEKLTLLFEKVSNVQHNAQAIIDEILYYLTDKDHEFQYLRKFNLKTGQDDVVEKYDWDIIQTVFSPSLKYRITTLNEDGKTTLKLHDLEKNTPVDLPKPKNGMITTLRLSKSEKQFISLVEGDSTPGDLYLTHIGESHTQRLTESLNPAINKDDLVEGEVIRFPSYDGKMIPSLYLKPHGIKDGEKRPALIYVHGGPGGQSRSGYNYLVQYLVNHGYPVLMINNRGSSRYGKSFYQAADLKHGEADLDDCIEAKKFLIAQGTIDPNKIGIIGGSYGGYMTLAALAFRPEEMAVGIDIFGVSNWVRTLESIPSWWESEREGLYQKIGNPQKDRDYLNSISPLFHAQKIRKPLLVIQGANDPRVLKVESDQIVEEVLKNHVPCQYVVFEDEGHGFLKKENKKRAAVAILDFLNLYLPQ